MARALRDEAYAELIVTGRHPGTGLTTPGDTETRFAAETQAMHRRVTSVVSARMRLQPPWPRLLGTPPWAVAGQLGAARVRRLRVAPGPALAAVEQTIRAGGVVPFFVGSRLLPRHVVLIVDAEVIDERVVGYWCYDPANGRIRPVRLLDLQRSRIGFERWNTAWWAIVAD